MMTAEALIQAWIDGEMTEDQKTELERLLREDSAVRRRFREITQFEATVRDWASVRSQPVGSPWPQASDSHAAKTAWYGRHPLMVMAAAACVLLMTVAGSVMWGRSRPDKVTARAEESMAGVAVLTRVWDAEFDSSTPLRAGDTLKIERLKLKRGMAQIEFFSGASLLLEGEADLELRSAWEAACYAGKVRVRVPPPARGFRLIAPGMNLVDLGTEFGLNVDAVKGSAEVHVFEGEVEAHPDHAEMRLLKGGEGLRKNAEGIEAVASLKSDAFASIEQLDQRTSDRQKLRYEQWSQWNVEARKDPRLLAFYLFKHWADDRWDRLVNNFTEPKRPAFAGAAVGVHWTQGRWPMKDALEFKGPGDRVRLNLGTGALNEITLAAWVRIDGLDRKYNALLLTDGYDAGEPHWQIYEDGALMFSIAYPDPTKPGEANAKRNQIYFSPPIFTLANQRRWHHVAVSYDNQSGEAVQYLDGVEISREVSPYHSPGRPIILGPAELGNWGMPTEKHKFPIRNLNGRIDEFAIYKVALPAADIQKLYEAGRPE